MKQKYLITKNDEKDELIIKEFTVDGKEDIFQLLCEAIYDNKSIESAIIKGKRALISVLRTRNMFPPSFYAGIIAESVVKLYSSQGNEFIELFFNDKDLLSKDLKMAHSGNEHENEDETVEFDELLEEESDEP